MTITVDATYHNGTFKFAQPVSLPEGAKVRLIITPFESTEALSERVHGNKPWFVWSKAIYRARKTAQEFSKETDADY